MNQSEFTKKFSTKAEQSIEHRPWGYFIIIEEGDNYKIKKLVVYPNKRLSLQAHNHRSENWIVVEGCPHFLCNDLFKEFKIGENLFIPKNAVHRIENKGITNASIIEVQTGSYLGEDDIIRFEDDFNRI